MVMLSPLRGLRPWGTGLDFVDKVPKPAIVAVTPSARASPMVENAALSAASAPVLDMEVRVATPALYPQVTLNKDKGFEDVEFQRQ